MAGTNLVYQFETLETCSRRMGTAIGMIDTISGNINQKKNFLVNNWQGDTKNAYEKRCSALIEKLDELYKALDSDKKKLDEVIKLQRQTEDEQVKKVDALSADNIF